MLVKPCNVILRVALVRLMLVRPSIFILRVT